MRVDSKDLSSIHLHGYRVVAVCLLALLSACVTEPKFSPENMASIIQALEESTATRKPDNAIDPPPEVTAALLPKIRNEPVEVMDEVESRFDVFVKSADASQFFMSLVKGTDINMVVHPDVSGLITLSLRDVTVKDVLSTVSDIHGYRYRRQGNTYQVYPATMRTQVFSIDYLDIVRNGNSRTSVNSGEIDNDSVTAVSSTSDTSVVNGVGTASGPGSEVRTGSESNFWRDLRDSLNLIIGTAEGRKVIVHSQSGVVVVHARHDELADVQEYLDTIESVAHRLVVLEAKVIEVNLNDNFQTGINWNTLFNIDSNNSISVSHSGNDLSSAANALGGIFAINANLQDFTSLIELIGTQGDVQVLSSPRISTVNNQKAVIKVGQDEYFVTDFETETELADGIGNQNVDVSLTPFFSGVALDVLPQIDADNNVLLHIHPAISEVMEKTKNIKISTESDLSIPLALSTIRESDSVVRVQSGQVIVVGGLMKNSMRMEESHVPGLGDIPVLGELFRNRREVSTKSELVILLRPIVVNSDEQWGEQLRTNTSRFNQLRAIDENDWVIPSLRE